MRGRIEIDEIDMQSASQEWHLKDYMMIRINLQNVSIRVQVIYSFEYNAIQYINLTRT